MIQLTGKAKQDFENWFNNKCYDSFLEFEDLLSNNKELNIIRNVLIIEWFDSVKITIDRNSYDKEMTITNWIDGLEKQTIIDCDYLEPFEDWWNEAIEKANTIYNNLLNLKK